MSQELQAAPPRRVKRSYTEEEIVRGLTELALCRGNDRLAAERLKAQGNPIPRNTIQSWAKNKPDTYQRIRSDVVPQVHAQIAQEAEDNASLAAIAERLAIEATIAQIAAGQTKDPSTSARNMSTVRGINIDKAALLRGRPTQIVETRSAEEILNSLAAKVRRLTGQTINSTAEELHDDEQTEDQKEQNPPPVLRPGSAL